jgi:nucleoid-associated protein YgaU
MPYPHPQYKDILVYTDRPRPGAFYQVKKGDNLSRLSNRAYGHGT